MSGVKRSDTGTKVSIPDELYHAILRIQVNDHLDFDRAAAKAAALIDSDSPLFNDAVRVQVQRWGQSQFMKQLNATRETIRRQHRNG